jgi:hypothetical protein
MSLLDQHIWYAWNSGLTTHAVGKKKANAFGLYDMQGHVDQWCSDWFGDHYYEQSPPTDPPGPPKAEGRVVRGGHFGSDPRDLRFAKRQGRHPHLMITNWLGFRVVEASPTTGLKLRVGEVTAGNEAVFRLLGPAVPFRIRDIRGDVEVSPRQGKMPDVIQVIGKDRESRGFSFIVERVDTGEAVPVSGVLFSPDWDVKFYSWEHAKSPPPAPDWRRIFAGKPLEERKTTQIDFNWGPNAPGAKIPADYFALVATTELDLPAGHYEAGIIGNQGYRVFLDGNKIIDEWTDRGLGKTFMDMELKGGKHAIRLECCKDRGEAHLNFSIQCIRLVQ